MDHASVAKVTAPAPVRMERHNPRPQPAPQMRQFRVRAYWYVPVIVDATIVAESPEKALAMVHQGAKLGTWPAAVNWDAGTETWICGATEGGAPLDIPEAYKPGGLA